MTEPLFCTPETNSTLQIICISIKMFKKKEFQSGCAGQKCGHPVLPDVKFFIFINDLSHCLIPEKSRRVLFLKSPYIPTPGRYNKTMSCSYFLNECVWHEMLNFYLLLRPPAAQTSCLPGFRASRPLVLWCSFSRTAWLQHVVPNPSLTQERNSIMEELGSRPITRF